MKINSTDSKIQNAFKLFFVVMSYANAYIYVKEKGREQEEKRKCWRVGVSNETPPDFIDKGLKKPKTFEKMPGAKRLDIGCSALCTGLLDKVFEKGV